MAFCINKRDPEYQNLQKRSGLPEDELEAVCRGFLDRHGRFPHLDEIVGADSELSLREELKVSERGSINIEETLSATGHESIEEMVLEVNDTHRDVEVEVMPIEKEAMVRVTKRPTVTNMAVREMRINDSPDSYLVFTKALTKLGSLYGIRFKSITDAKLDGFPDEVLSASAFVYNGDIYINLDKATVDAPLHEMMHILAGSIRYSDPLLYLNIIKSVEQLPNYDELAKKYLGRTHNDISEEILISEAARYITGQDSIISKLDSRTQYEITYNIKRVLDTMLMGEDSVKTLPETGMYDLSFKAVAQAVNSSLMVNNFKGFVNTEYAMQHRKINNFKQDLMKKKLLIEECK